MITTRRMLKAVATLLPMGALGISVTLAGVPGKEHPPVTPPDTGEQGVADRLQAIRSVVSKVTAEQSALAPGDPDIEKVWWGNWGGGGVGWRNGGWRNGGWPNWRNGWHNWPNWNNY